MQEALDHAAVAMGEALALAGVAAVGAAGALLVAWLELRRRRLQRKRDKLSDPPKPKDLP